MSELDNVHNDYDVDEYDEMYDNAEILAIQEEYRRQRLKETLIGPVISTLFHIGLIIALAILVTDKYKKEVAEIVVQMEEVEEVKIEEPPPVEEPEPVEEPQEDVTNPVLTTVAIDNVDMNDAALEDVSDDVPSTDDDSTVEAVADIVVSPSAFASPSVFGGRSAAGRASAVSKFGGSKVGQASLLKALYWLKKVQNPDGSWGNKNPEAFTGLALLTFLAHGETPSSQNFGHTVRKAMEWLINDPVNPKAGRSYAHAIKSYAIAEAYAMMGISELEGAMNSNIAEVIKGMQDSGSYDYEYKKGDRKEDLSLAGWNYQALKAAYGAGVRQRGLLKAIEKAVSWLKKCAGSNSNGDGFPYALYKGKPNAKHAGRHTMRGVGVLCLQLFGEGQTPEIKDEIAQIATEDLAKLSYTKPPRESLYGWYYATQAMFQKGGVEWKNWNRKFQKELTANQHTEGYWEYPGHYHGAKGDETTERVYATTLCALMLTVYYRYLPSTKGAIGAKATDKGNKPVMEEDEGINLIE